MCSNFESIHPKHANWVKQHFACDLPNSPWREEIYPTYPAPFIYLDNGNPKCELAQFGLVPHWATNKRKFGLRTYNARSETVAEKPSYRSAWKERRFGLALMNSFYEPNWETGKAVRWRIKRAEAEPVAVASIWERFIDKETGEIIFSFSMLTINADGHEVMQHFHKPDEEKRSVVVLQDQDYLSWLNANLEEATSLLQLAPNGFLESLPADKKKPQQTTLGL
ncbi:MAG: SOS response-associated peptidase family protein [Oscillospiraceae bacterium]